MEKLVSVSVVKGQRKIGNEFRHNTAHIMQGFGEYGKNALAVN